MRIRPDRGDTLDRLIGETEPVMSVYELTGRRPSDEIDEIYSKAIGHVLLTKTQSQTAIDNTRLAGISPSFAFGEVHNAEHMLMLVPKGTKKLSTNLQVLLGNLGENGAIFQQIGSVLNVLEQNYIGLPLSDQPLDRFAWAPDYASVNGVRALLVPPFDIEDPRGLDTRLTELNEGLLLENVDTIDKEFIIDQVQNGWFSIG